MIFTIAVISAICSCSETEGNHVGVDIPKPEQVWRWKQIESPTKAHLRGLDITTDGTIWASGTQGTILSSQDTGKTWTSNQIPNCEEIDFRDVEGFNQSSACIMSSGNGVRFYTTSDGGKSWNLSYEDTNRKVFYDGIDFSGGFGMAYGDPMDDKLSVLKSTDSGKSWIAMGRGSMPTTMSGEAGFAASGTGIVVHDSTVWIATGGASESRVFLLGMDGNWKTISTPLTSAASSGIFSMAFADEFHGILVGGDYIDSTRNTDNAAYSEDGGSTWTTPKSNPNGYRSCVVFSRDGGLAIATGRSGTDYSIDQGKNWKSLSDQGYYSCVILGTHLIGVGRSGKIGRLDIRHLNEKASD